MASKKKSASYMIALQVPISCYLQTGTHGEPVAAIELESSKFGNVPSEPCRRPYFPPPHILFRSPTAPS
eukprot:492661-Pelagomonas_calceolata.AAC.1